MTGWGLARIALIRTVASIMSIGVACVLFGAAGAAAAGPTAAAPAANAALYRFAPAPGWVARTSAEYEAPVPPGGVSEGVWQLLLDRQINETSAGDEFYQHSAVRVLSPSGVEERSQIDIVVDPTFQSLDLNSIRIIRQGKAIDAKPTARITALPEETELRERIYDGSYKINILLSDVRVGDVIEYEYTMHSVERLFPGQKWDRMSVAWSVPVRHQRLRVLSAANEPLFFRMDDQSVPKTTLRGGFQELNWEWYDLAAIYGDENRPDWYSPWPRFQVTSSKDWAEVARRVLPLYQVRDPRTPVLMSVVEEIRKGGGTQSDQALRALQFVQEQIRYVSISIGPGAVRPADPATVLERRFGDCKDKTLLLVTILRALGIDAEPALVHTRRGRTLNTDLPSPYAFNHAIVHMKLGGESYWLDGTAYKQYSPVTANIGANFGWALVIDEATSGLTAIPPPRSESSAKRSEVLVDMRAGTDKPAKLQISTFYEGRLADSTRDELANETAAERQSNYINYIEEYYPGARTSAPITIHDDQSKNVIEVREYYEIAKPFSKDSRGRLEFFLQADEIYHYLNAVKSRVRKSPLAISYPIRIEQTIRAMLPQDWPSDPETVTISNPAFFYRSDVSYSNKGGVPELKLDYRYESLRDSVDVAALPKYLEDRHRAYDDLGFYVRPSKQTVVYFQRRAAATATLPRYAGWLTLILAALLCSRFLYRWNPPGAKAQPHWPVGIRGWLLVPAVSTFLSPVNLFFSLRTFAMYLDTDHWSRLPELVAAPWKGSIQVIVLAVMICGISLLIAEAYLILMFFQRRTSAPAIFIACRWIEAGLYAATVFLPVAAHLKGAPQPAAIMIDAEVFGAVFRAAIYTAYLVVSKRVKATFIARRPPPPAPGTRSVFWPLGNAFR